MDIQSMLDAEQQIVEYLVNQNMAGTAEDVQTLIHEVRRLRRVEDAVSSWHYWRITNPIFPRSHHEDEHLQKVLLGNPRP